MGKFPIGFFEKCLNWAWWHTHLIPALKGQRQAILYEFEADLVYSKFQASQEYTVRPCLKEQKTLNISVN